jgi:chaperone required for assembly of F1-ATPase
LDLRKGFHEPAEKPRRFYKAVMVADAEGGFQVQLDGRNLRTPQARRMLLPTRAVADQVAEEWASQGEILEMATMPATRLANTAIEAIPDARPATADQIAQYAGSDLVCYFAEGPDALIERQRGAWEPLLAQAETHEGLRFERCAGIIHREQPAETLQRVRELALALDDFALAGLAFGTALFGSAVLALALQRDRLSGEEAFVLSRIDEVFQEERWGLDEEAAERAARLRGDAVMLSRWFRGLRA